MPHHTQKLECVISTNKNILLHTHNTTISIRKLTLMYHYRLLHRLHSSSANYPNNVLYHKGVSPESDIAFSCQISLISFKLESFFNIFLIFMTLIYFEDYRPFLYNVSQLEFV